MDVMDGMTEIESAWAAEMHHPTRLHGQQVAHPTLLQLREEFFAHFFKKFDIARLAVVGVGIG